MKNIKTFYLSIDKQLKTATLHINSFYTSDVFTRDVLLPNLEAINTILAPLIKKKYTISIYYNDKAI